jgi:hypothetical protein
MADAPSKRLSFDYRTGKNSQTDQGTIHCELLVYERGSWVSLPVYSIASETANGRQTITGYVESQTDQKFRALLTYCHPNSRRTSKWHIDHHVLCTIHVDGRKKPVCEYSKWLERPNLWSMTPPSTFMAVGAENLQLSG